MHIYTIYRATCLKNNKKYIGFASHWPNRKSYHKWAAITRKIDSKFYRAIRKHGWDAFHWDVVYQSLDANHTKDVMEYHFIKENDSFVNGYNSTLGGDGTLGIKRTPHQIQSLVEHNKKVQTGIRRPHVGSSHRGIPNLLAKERMLTNNPMKRIDVKEKVRQKVSGPSSKIATQTIHTFFNKQTQELISMTQSQFNVTYGLDTGNVSRLVNGKCEQYKNWTIVFYSFQDS